MLHVVVYQRPSCPYCQRATQLLREKNIDYQDIDITVERGLFDEMVKKSGRRTVPQIFINDIHIGGCDDLFALEEESQLDAFLKQGE
jgi:glutaredoxin 3